MSQGASRSPASVALVRVIRASPSPRSAAGNAYKWPEGGTSFALHVASKRVDFWSNTRRMRVLPRLGRALVVLSVFALASQETGIEPCANAGLSLTNSSGEGVTCRITSNSRS
jgi:hypothetical protein